MLKKIAQYAQYYAHESSLLTGTKINLTLLLEYFFKTDQQYLHYCL